MRAAFVLVSLLTFGPTALAELTESDTPTGAATSVRTDDHEVIVAIGWDHKPPCHRSDGTVVILVGGRNRVDCPAGELA